MKTVLVTGGAGFIGCNFVRHLLSQEFYRVVNLDKLTYAGNLASLEEIADDTRHIFVHGDVGDTEMVADLLERHRPAAVVNLAAESHVDRSIDGPMEFVATNVVGTCRLLDVLRVFWQGLSDEDRAGFRFIQVSTDEVYGSLGLTGEFTEATPYAPNSPYSASKAAADHFVRAYYSTYEMPTITTNCSNNYGPFQFPEKLIPLMILNAFDGRPLPVYGDGNNVRDWLFVEDHCEALRLVLERGTPGERYNIGGSAERTNLEVVRSICEIVDAMGIGSRMPAAQLIAFVPDRPGHDPRYAINSSRIRRELGWAPCETFESGLESTVRWYLNNKTWVDRVSKDDDDRQRKGLPQSAGRITVGSDYHSTARPLESWSKYQRRS